MRAINIQVQPDRVPNMNLDEVKAAFVSLSESDLVEEYDFSEDADKGRYLNFTYGTNDAASLWKEIKSSIFENETLSDEVSRCSMAMCSSEEGWDDYLLLHHFDPSVTLDDSNEL